MGTYLRRKGASEYLLYKHGVPRATNTLAKLAVIGGGPLYCLAGRIPLYSTDDLDSWVAALLSPPMRSTSGARMRSTSDTLAKTPPGDTPPIPAPTVNR
jgi:hypothetical protein